MVHHSDRGVQYASSKYISLLKGSRISISMTENGDPKENLRQKGSTVPSRMRYCLDISFAAFVRIKFHDV
jgi:hypothetical protein